MTGMCFGPQGDKSRGYVCHYAQAGAEEGDLLSHWVGFYGTASSGQEKKKTCNTGSNTNGKKPSRGSNGSKDGKSFLGKSSGGKSGPSRGRGGKLFGTIPHTHNSFLNIAVAADYVDSNGFSKIHEFGTCQDLTISPLANTKADDKYLMKGSKIIAAWMQPKEKKNSKDYGRNQRSQAKQSITPFCFNPTTSKLMAQPVVYLTSATTLVLGAIAGFTTVSLI
jgi:hypothetical protein